MRVIFSSYGNDSVALIQWAHAAGLREVSVVYTDTGWAASYWQERVKLGEQWVKSLGFEPVRISSAGMVGLVRKKKAWPRGGGGRFQFCTQHLKVGPALAWLDQVDPDRDAICMVGIRREESANRTQFPEWTEESPSHGGRSLHAPLVRHLAIDRDALVARAPMPLLETKSKECWPCVNARKAELKFMDEAAIARVEAIEQEMGVNSKGNARVMFSPARHGGAVGIRAVIEEAKRGQDDLLFPEGCDGGWCGS